MWSRPRGYEGVPERYADAIEHRRMLARAINRLTGGKFNATLELTLRANETTTPVSDPRLAPVSCVLWMPRTASASAAVQAGIWVSGRTKGAAVLHHAASAAADQELTLLILG